MVELVYHRHFYKSVRILPAPQLKKLSRLLGLLQKDAFDPVLHTKRLVGPFVGFLSFRISRDWRVIFQFLNPEKIQLLRVAHRKEAYQ